MDLQSQLAESDDEIVELKAEIEKLKAKLVKQTVWEKKEKEYELSEPYPGGAIVWKNKSNPNILACPACWNKKKFVPLQYRGPFGDCPDCKASYSLQKYQNGILEG